MSFSKAKLIRFNDIVPECQSPAALKLPKDKVTVTVKSKKPEPSPKTEYHLTKSVPVTFKTPTLPKKVKTATNAMKIKPKDLFNNDSETLGFKSQECENNTKYIHNLTEQLDALKKELSDLNLEKEHLQRQQQKEIQELEFEMLKTMTQLQRQEEEANIRIKNLEQRMSSEISTLNETHEYHIGQLILDCEIKLKDVKEVSESILKQRIEEMEEHWRKKLQEKEKESEEILKECQAISEYSIIQCELEKKAIENTLEKITEEYCNLQEQHKQLISSSENLGSLEKTIDNRINQLTKIIDEKEEEIRKLSLEIKTYDLTINNAQVTIEVLKNRLIHSDKDVEHLKQDLIRCEEEILKYEDRYYQMSSALSEAKHYNEEMELQFESALKLNEQIINNIRDELLSKVQMYQNEVKKFTQKEMEEKNMKDDIMEQLNYNIDVIKKINVEVDKTEKCYSLQVKELKETIEYYVEKEKTFIKNIDVLKDENCSLQVDISQKNVKVNELEEKILKLNNENEYLTEKYNYYKNKAEELESDTIESSQTRKKYIDLSGRYDIMMQDLEVVEMENTDLRNKLSLNNEKIIKLLDIEEKYEKLLKEKLSLETENVMYKNKLEKKYKFNVKDKENIGSPNRSVIDSPSRGSPFRERN